MNRCPDLVVCLKRDLQYLRPQASLVLIYRSNVAGMKGRVDIAQPVNRTQDLWCGNTIHHHSTLFSPIQLTAVPLELGSNAGEDMNVCKCIVLSRHGDTLNSRRAPVLTGGWWKRKRAETSKKEIDQAREEEPDEIIDSNHESETKFEKNDGHMKRLSRKEDFANAT
ncbi:hypothetical protein TNCV_220691 [Trichonephila clavipes]|nr:hypothetical protein TNCV_220691 [Trichonephila clavipes]